MNNIALLLFGLLLSVLGIVNILGNVSTIHAYNRRKVNEEDIPKYGRAIGIGTLIIGAAFLFSFIATLLRKDLVEIIMAPAFATGLGFMLYAQFKYNKGIF